MDKDKNLPEPTIINADPNAVIFNKKYQNIEDVYNAYGGSSFKLDLGCGYVKPEGFIGVDNLSGEASQIPNIENAPDILMNLDVSAFPFPNNSCEEVRSSHFLEHSQLMHILTESHRVLRPGGTFLFAVPYANSAEGMYPGHQQFLTEKWFYKNLNFQRYFTIESEEYFPSDDYLKLPLILRAMIPFKFARTFLFNACWQMIFRCSAKK
jgi:SAM-dependent methyltransferase